ncbi:hypothetical protein TcCL_NonESM09605 [Trypanosoma cruzi]|nr:hypothetical protein TcCL_NonESM09605 [Trypanosoma cruzi]
MPHPDCKSQVRLQHTLPPPGRVRPLAARRSKWDHQKHQFGNIRPPPQQSRSPFLTKTKACGGAADGGTHSRRVMDCRRKHATAMRPSLGPPNKKHVSRSPREQHTLNRIQLHYCGHPHTQHECDNAGKEARNTTTHPSHKGQAASVLPSTIIPPHTTPLHIRSKKAHTVCTTLNFLKSKPDHQSAAHFSMLSRDSLILVAASLRYHGVALRSRHISPLPSLSRRRK